MQRFNQKKQIFLILGILNLFTITTLNVERLKGINIPEIKTFFFNPGITFFFFSLKVSFIQNMSIEI